MPQQNCYLLFGKKMIDGISVQAFMIIFYIFFLHRCEKGSPSNKQLMLCLSESQRKLLDGIGFSCKDKVERVMMECSGYV